MEFRWVALIALWTMLIGPVLDLAPGTSKANPHRPPRHAVQSKLTR
jgi:hypothetical protein